MPKVSRPIVYTVVGAIAVYAVFLYTQPATPTTHRTTHVMTTSRTADPNGILPEDLHAHFARYAGGTRDPFVPGVVIARAPAAAKPAARGLRGEWVLTGINSVNGVTSALIENSATGESVFLQPGDHWNGLRVLSIDPNSIIFQNVLGQQTQMAFAQPDDKSNNAPGSAPSPGTGTGGFLGPLPPLPILPPTRATNANSRPDAATSTATAQRAPNESSYQP